MSLKVKLTSTICAFFLILGLVITGVFAVPQATVQLGGTLSFQAGDVYAKVTGGVSGAKETNPTFPELTFAAGSTPDVSGWANQNLVFNDTGSAITITVTIENLASDRPLYASVSDSVGAVANVTKSMTESSEKYVGGVLILDAKESTTVTITMSVTDANASLAEGATWGYLIKLQDQSDIKTTSYYATEEGNYLEFSLNTSAKTASVSAMVGSNAEGTGPEIKSEGDVVIPALVKNASGDVFVVETIMSLGSGEYSSAVSKITSISMPNTIKTIAGNAFYLCKELKSVSIPESVTSIGDYAFSDCTSLSEVKLTNNITNIGSGVFLGCEKLTEVVWPNQLTTIGAVGGPMFGGCTSLKTIYIPKTVTNILDYSFTRCTALTDVYYEGTEEEWGQITIGNEENANDSILNATIHFDSKF